MQNYTLACLMAYLLSLNIDYWLLTLMGIYGVSNSVPMLCNGGGMLSLMNLSRGTSHREVTKPIPALQSRVNSK